MHSTTFALEASHRPRCAAETSSTVFALGPTPQGRAPNVAVSLGRNLHLLAALLPTVQRLAPARRREPLHNLHSRTPRHAAPAWLRGRLQVCSVGSWEPSQTELASSHTGAPSSASRSSQSSSQLAQRYGEDEWVAQAMVAALAGAKAALDVPSMQVGSKDWDFMSIWRIP